MRAVLHATGWIYKIITGVVAVGVSFVLSSLSFSLPFDRDLILTKINAVVDSPDGKLSCGIAGILTLAVALLYCYLKVKDSQRDATIAFDNPDGEVCISMTAIEDFVIRVGKEFSEIKHLEPKIKARKEGVDIKLKVELWSGMNLPKMTESLQNVIKSQVQNILGIENVHSVEVMVHKIISRDKEHGMPTQSDMFHEGGNVQQGGEENFQ
jgi:hypothetical protein